MLCDQVRGVPGVRAGKRARQSPRHHTSPDNETAAWHHRTLDRLRYLLDEGVGGDGDDESEGLGDGDDKDISWIP